MPFEVFKVPSEWKWSHAFYKLDALLFAASLEYEYVLGLDADTYSNGSFDELWRECDCGKPLLYPLSCKVSERSRQIINNGYESLFQLPESKLIPQIGGEFIAGTRESVLTLVAAIKKVYDRVEQRGFKIDPEFGDEALLSMAAAEIEWQIALPYIRRYWTRRRYYNSDTAYSSVPIWHLPAEKNFGLNIIFNHMKKGKLINPKIAALIFNFPPSRRYSLSMLAYYAYNIINR